MKLPNVEEVFPLSPMQQGMLYRCLLAPGSGAYVEQVGWRMIDGDFDEPAFEAAWQAVAHHHAALRAAFFWEGLEQPLQVVRQSVRLGVERHDWRGLPDLERRLEELLEADRRRGLSLSKAPLMRLTRIRLQEGHQLLWTYHHLLLDGWSVSLVLKDVFFCYEAIRRGLEPRLEPGRPYRDYIAWLQRHDLAAAEQFWREALAGFVAPTSLAGDGKRAAAESGAPEELCVPRVVTAALQSLAREHRLTLSTLVSGAWALLLSRRSGERDVVFGSVVSGRPPDLAGVEEVVGLLINTLPLRVRVEPEERVFPYLAEVQARQLAIQRWEHSPLTRVQGWSEVAGGQPLFASLAAFDNTPIDKALRDRGGSLGVRDLFRADTRTGYPLTLQVSPGSELRLRILYDRSLFEPLSIRRLLGHLERLLAEIAADADRPLAALDLLRPEERHQLLVEWNDTAVEPPDGQTLTGLFEEQVERARDAVAVTSNGHRLSYGELAGRANRLAWRLRDLGVGPETRVGICAGRSPEMVAGVLAILKAGGAYVPLDPAYPPERLALLLADSGVAVLLTERWRMEALSRLFPAPLRLAALDADPGRADGPAAGTRPENLAYVIYTSGSTGRPKGVQVSHGNVAHLFTALRSRFHPGRRDVWTLFHSFAFDFSVWELWGALLHGGRLVVVSYEQSRSPAAFLELLNDEGVTVLSQTPLAFRELGQAEGGRPGRLPALRLVIFGGEALEGRHLRGWRWDHPAALVNLYGITETTVHVTWYPLTGLPERAVPIGRGIGNMRLYVLDEGQQPVPAGVVGEVYVGGPGVARGYLDRAEWTAERFVPDRYGGGRGERLYRTGDLARWGAGGDLEYVGRADHQVKVRGFRIEPGEVEAALCAHPGVKEAVVVARSREDGPRQLTAYVVPQAGRPRPSARELREHLAAQLPEPLVPSRFVLLADLPLTASGKVDRRNLPDTEAKGWEPEQPFVPPQGQGEQALAQVWSQVLGLPRVGARENFFELGGDSILAMQVVSRARQAGLRLTPQDLFLHPTITELAAAAGTATEAAAEQGPVQGPVPLTPIQRWFFEQVTADPHYYNQALLLEVDPQMEPRLLERAWDLLLAHHDALRLRFVAEGRGWRQHNAGAEESAVFSRVDLSRLPADLRRAAVKEAAPALQASLDLARGPLVRVALFEQGPDRPHLLLGIVHHLAVDGVSWRILLEDLQSACDRLSRGERLDLAAKTTSFQRWAELLQQWAGSTGLAREAVYWQEVTSRPADSLPVDLAGGGNTWASLGQVVVSLTADETRALLQEVPKAYRTQVQEVLLTGLAQVLCRWTGRGELLLDLEGHGREAPPAEADLTRTVGWFTSLFPMRLDLRGATVTGAALKRVKEQLRGVPRGGVGYGLLRYLSTGEAAGGLLASCRAEVSFNYLGRFDASLPASSRFRLSEAELGPTRSPSALRAHLLEIDSGISGDRLVMVWSYSRELHRRPTIEALGDELAAALRDLIEHCRSAGAGGYTASDFPLARLGQRELDELYLAYPELEDVYPLSPMQAGLLFHSLRTEGAQEYFEQFVFTLDGEVRAAELARAWQEMVDRHGVLRTAFLWRGILDQDGGEPLQLLHRHAELPFRIVDWQGLPDEVRLERLERFLEEDRRRGFDLSVPPLIRLTWLRLGPRRHWLVWSHHHLVLDGWSVSQLFSEVSAVYDDLCQGRRTAPAVRRPYREYIEWLRRQDLAAAEEFWRRELEGFTEPTPLAGAERAGGSTVWELETLHLSAQLDAGLRALSRKHRLTLATLVAGAWALLLGRYGDRREVVFGVTLAGRPVDLEGSQSMVGLFINTLPVRLGMPPYELLPGWLERLQTRQAELARYVHAPLAQVQAWSAVPRGRALFDSILIFENYPLASASGSLGIEEVRVEERTHYPLSLAAIPGEAGEGLALKLLYDCGRFEPLSMRRLMGHLERLVEGMAHAPDRPLSALDLLSAAERHQILTEWNDTAVELPAGLTLTQLFHAQVERTPDAVAVAWTDHRLSYRELDRQACRLARRLRGLGVGPEVRVGICAERSLEMVVGVLAILEAGGAYVPLDPAYPRERLELLLEDSGAALLLTPRRLMNRFPPARVRVIPLEAEADAEGCARDRDRGPRPEHLAYVLYTSGSTGRPKGVEVRHRAVAGYVAADSLALGVLPGDRCLQFAPLTFDTSVLEIFFSICRGAVLVLRTDEMAGSPAGFFAGCRLWGITLAFLPTAVWHELTAGFDAEAGPPLELRIVAFGGERALGEPLARWRRWTEPRVLFFNEYGPTESTVVATRWAAAEHEEQPSGAPIGRPLDNVRVYVLGDDDRAVPLGVAGELCIGGHGLARGYAGKPDLTADRFRPDRFGAEGSRLYRSGDLAAWSPDGNLRFLGRVDQQVKVRGFRIEPGEVESALAGHPGVREVAVTAVPDSAGGHRLAAYFVSHPPAPTAGELRAYLKERLPQHMVPAVFVELEELPKTPTDKVDRQALPSPGYGRPQLEQPLAPPRTEAEAVLASLWAEVLGLDEVGIHDDFFELGGDSLLSLRIAARAGERGYRLVPGQLFEHRTIAELAHRLQRRTEVPVVVSPAGAGDLTPSGFPDAELSQRDLGRLLARLGKEEGGR